MTKFFFRTGLFPVIVPDAFSIWVLVVYLGLQTHASYTFQHVFLPLKVAAMGLMFQCWGFFPPFYHMRKCQRQNGHNKHTIVI